MRAAEQILADMLDAIEEHEKQHPLGVSDRTVVLAAVAMQLEKIERMVCGETDIEETMRIVSAADRYVTLGDNNTRESIAELRSAVLAWRAKTEPRDDDSKELLALVTAASDWADSMGDSVAGYESSLSREELVLHAAVTEWRAKVKAIGAESCPAGTPSA